VDSGRLTVRTIPVGKGSSFGSDALRGTKRGARAWARGGDATRLWAGDPVISLAAP